MIELQYNNATGILTSKQFRVNELTPSPRVSKTEHESAFTTQTWLMSSKLQWQITSVSMAWLSAKAIYDDLVLMLDGRQVYFKESPAANQRIVMLMGTPAITREGRNRAVVSFGLREF